MADEKEQIAFRQFKVNRIPTMKVTRKEDGVECVINQSDFDPEVYSQERVAPRKPSPAAKKATPKADAKQLEE